MVFTFNSVCVFLNKPLNFAVSAVGTACTAVTLGDQNKSRNTVHLRDNYHSAKFAMGVTSSVFSTSWWTDRVHL